MVKKMMFALMLFAFGLIMTGCSEDEIPVDVDNGIPNDEEPNDEEPNEDELPADLDGTRVVVGSLESRENKEHLITILQAGVYNISSVALFDATGVLYHANGEHIRGSYKTGDFLIIMYLEPGDYKVEVRGATRDEFGAYGVHVEYQEALSHVHYYVVDQVRLSSVNEHSFTIETAGNYSIIGESEINIQGTLYNDLGSYLTTDHDSHTGGGFIIQYYFEPGVYEIHIRGYDWSAAAYEILITRD